MHAPRPVRRRALGAILAIGAAVPLALISLPGGAVAGQARPATKPPKVERPPRISGAAVEGAVLSSDTGRWGGSRVTRWAFQWQLCDAGGACTDVAGAIDRVYAVPTAAVGKALRVTVTATNAAGVVTALSEQTRVVTASAPDAPRPVSPPSLTGTLQVGSKVAVQAGGWTGRTPIDLSIEWRLCDSAGGACSVDDGPRLTRQLTQRALGHTIRLLVVARNKAGWGSFLTSPTSIVKAAATTVNPPTNTSVPTISGAPINLETLTASPGSWKGGQPITFSYRWQRCPGNESTCADIGGATNRSYRMTGDDIGRHVRVVVTARNSQGTGTAASAMTATITAAGPFSTRAPSISGQAREGATLRVDPGAWAGSKPIALAYRWQRCAADGKTCQDLGATGQTYVVRGADVGRRLRAVVTGSNRGGGLSVASAMTGVVQARPVTVTAPTNTAAPTVTGAARETETLTAQPGTWNGTGPLQFTYQWQRCDTNGANCVDVAGATGQTYRMTTADVGHRLRVVVKAANGAGQATAASAPTSIVAEAGPSGAVKLPSGATSIPVSSVALPAQLLIDRVTFTPARIRSRIEPLAVRVHISDTRGYVVRDAVVHVTGVPFDRLTASPEVTTDTEGWATLSFRVRPALKLRRGNLLVLFVRARKPGDNPLAGVSARRLVSVRIG